MVDRRKLCSVFNFIIFFSYTIIINIEVPLKPLKFFPYKQCSADQNYDKNFIRIVIDLDEKMFWNVTRQLAFSLCFLLF